MGRVDMDSMESMPTMGIMLRMSIMGKMGDIHEQDRLCSTTAWAAWET